MNIGSVIYKKDFSTGKLNAKWNLRTEKGFISGTGLAEGPAGSSYSGEYSIIYHNSDGSDSGPFILKISEKDGNYLLNWFRNENKVCTGLGMLHNNVLIAGWKNC